MAYVPYQQWSSSLHSAERALDAGTLFPVLDKPFYGRRGEQMSEEQAMRRRIAAMQFAMWELHLFLDTHPNNCDAAKSWTITR